MPGGMGRSRSDWYRGVTGIAEGIAGFAAVTCDVFDTAIRRRLARPGDVLLVVGARLAAAGLCGLRAEGFRAAREAAEAAMRREAAARGEDEPRIGEVYGYLADCGVVTEAAPAARVELACEIAVCEAVPEVRDAMVGGKGAADREVLFVSDSILPGAWIAELLVACGYPADVRVVSSADARLSKDSGRMFAHALGVLGRAAGEVVHVGDNPHSDGVRARAAGLATVMWAARGLGPERGEVAAGGAMLRLLHSYRRAMGGEGLHRYASLMAIGWTLDILAAARAVGARRVYFMARDGWLPLEIARRVVARTGEEIELRYLAVSRRALSDELAGGYLAQEGFCAPGMRVVVDVGWRGTSQVALGRLGGVAAGEMLGCYLGLLPDALRPELGPGNTRCALFGFGDPAGVMGMVMDGYVLPELFFSAPHGTVLGYERRGGRVEPVFAAEDGGRVAAFAAIAEGVLAEFDALDGMLDGAWEAVSREAMLFDLAPLLTTPEVAEVRAINAIRFINGPDGTGGLPAINPMPWHEMLLHPARAMRRARDCPWRAGWVRLHLPWPAPPMDYATFADRAGRLGLRA